MGETFKDRNSKDLSENTNKKRLNALNRPQKRHKANQKLNRLVDDINRQDYESLDSDEFDELYDAKGY